MNENNQENFEVKKLILDKIKQYDRIVISCHIRPDGDAVGSSKGLQDILRASFPNKEIYLINPEHSEHVAFLGADTDVLPDSAYQNALGIVVDTASLDRVSNKQITLAQEIIKIDHHINIKPYGNVSWVEDYRSSACEMIADFYYTFRGQLKLTKYAASCIYTGMVVDSGRFRFSSTSGETMRLAGFLLDQGIDLDHIYANIYLDDYAVLKFRSYVYKKMKITPNGVAYIYVDMAMQKRFGLSPEAASNVVTHLSAIKNSIIWLAFIENADKTIRARLRSRFVTINNIAEQYGGGGHDKASGATLTSKKQVKEMLAIADAQIKDYKENNEGWL